MNIRAFFAGLLGRGAEVRQRGVVWDASGAGRLSNWAAPSTNFSTTLPAPLLKERARDSYRNVPWARRAVDTVVVGAVGAGIKPQARTAATDLKRRIEREWLAWTDAADFAGRYDFYGFQQAALKAAMVDGEVLVRLIAAPDQRVPLQLQLLAGEYLDSSRVDGQTLNGIEYDAAGRRAAYWLYTKHPATFPNMTSVRVPAEQVIHMFAPVQPGMERGVSWLAPALVPLRELQEFTEAALVRQKVASLYAGYVQTADGSNPLAASNATPVLEPGTMCRLQPGEAVEFSEPPDVGQMYEPFVRQQLRAIGSALNVPYEILSGDLGQVTFASGRHALLEWRRQLESIQHHLLVFQFCRPVWAAWTRFAIAAGVLPGAPEDYADVRWIAPLPEMLDARMEVQSQIQKIRAGLMSRSEAVALTGLDAEMLDAEIATDNGRADALGNVYDSDARKVTLQGQSQQDAGAPQ